MALLSLDLFARIDPLGSMLPPFSALLTLCIRRFDRARILGIYVAESFEIKSSMMQVHDRDAGTTQ
jgi:hypothetical protein